MAIYRITTFTPDGHDPQPRIFNDFAKASEFYNNATTDDCWYDKVKIDLCDFVDGELKAIHTMATWRNPKFCGVSF